MLLYAIYVILYVVPERDNAGGVNGLVKGVQAFKDGDRHSRAVVVRVCVFSVIGPRFNSHPTHGRVRGRRGMADPKEVGVHSP
jgi:hypothetical protein